MNCYECAGSLLFEHCASPTFEHRSISPEPIGTGAWTYGGQYLLEPQCSAEMNSLRSTGKAGRA